jgi:hypothetical protein
MENNAYSKTQSATVSYVLHEKPEHILFNHAGSIYKTLLTGQTFVLAGATWIPVSGTPIPEKLPVLNFMAFLHRNARWIPAALLACVCIVLTHVCLLITDGAEFAAGWLQTFSAAMNTTLVVLALLTLVSWAISTFKKGLTIDLDFGVTKQLAAGSTDGISIAPDTAVFSLSDNETTAEYNARVKAAIEAAGGWVLVLPFQSEYGVIHTGGDALESHGHVFLRSNPPHDGGETFTAPEAAQAKQIYSRERWADYVAYCSEFARRYTSWAKAAKIQESANPLNIILNRATVFAVCMVLSFAGMAQKSVHVRKYLGELRYTQDAPTGEVDFVFRHRVYTRTAGGSKTWEHLLKDAPGYSDSDDAGKLVGITLDGKVVAPAGKQTKETAHASAVPVSDEIETLPKTKGFFESLPDSSELAVMKRQSIMERRAQWAKVEPTLEYYMWHFWQLMVLIAGIGGILFVLSKASATDAIHDLHGYPLIGNAITWLHISTKTVLFLILCIPTVVILGSDVITYYYTRSFSFVWLIRYALICWAWYYGFQKIIPDSPGSQGPNNRMGNYPNGQRFLN